MDKRSPVRFVVIGLALLIAGILITPHLQWLQDEFDGRPARKILILGNSRTFYNDMPGMLRKISDSAQDDHKLQFTLDAFAGASLETLIKTPEVASQLDQSWDDILIQAESRAQSSEENRQSFQTYGTQILSAAKVKNGRPKLIVNWAYSIDLFPERDTQARNAFVNDIQSDHRTLAETGNATLINVGLVWEHLLTTEPNIQLYQDGNHPSLAGSYLEALMIYKSLSPTRVLNVTYVPYGLSAETAETLRQVVANE